MAETAILSNLEFVFLARSRCLDKWDVYVADLDLAVFWMTFKSGLHSFSIPVEESWTFKFCGNVWRDTQSLVTSNCFCISQDPRDVEFVEMILNIRYKYRYRYRYSSGRPLDLSHRYWHRHYCPHWHCLEPLSLPLEFFYFLNS